MITGLYAALAGFMLVFLSISVIRGRAKYQVAINDGGEIALQQRIRAQANFVEYTPLFLLLLAVVETSGLAYWAVHVFGGVFLLGRILHAYAFLKDEKVDGGKIMNVSRWRIIGVMITLLSLIALALVQLALFIL